MAKLTKKEQTDLLAILQKRFEKNMGRHKGLVWTAVQKKIEAAPVKLASLALMEISGGEPDVVLYNKKTGEYTFYDCSPESPKNRRSFCYDATALKLRKEHKPENSAVAMADAMGVEILTEEQYRFLQTLGEFDQKTSSWIETPASIRKLGGALFCDRRYETVFVYHNGAESYYSGRAFRVSLVV